MDTKVASQLTDNERARLSRGLETPARSSVAPHVIDRPYYDSAADKVAKEAYWGRVRPELPNFTEAVIELLAQTHTRPLNYQPSKYVYPWSI